ncbi:hypothetical protein [uncultured Gammaproteobacteria bacterium]|nr:hypothetical protein [uncultured Gammaproteobacteria bacterium]CAC9643188.1 hypothetical protein [uncultured Gammaproteobacteria bacterium]CAC9648173.1 hypothetical protein [uncultured Gammaproteobacteria bacterium]CAC9648515.1 hypothetical protein [uncultured Gammaproteobacteria bacterium]CAC9989079.1 hypothetical protein [uncultured Gammaproteobacteria bacterium]
MIKSNFCPIGDFFEPCPSRTKTGLTQGFLLDFFGGAYKRP